MDRVSNENRFRRLVLITGHRRENFGKRFLQICHAIEMLSTTYADVDFVYQMHLNPNVRKPIEKVFNETPRENLFFIEPLDYLPFVYLIKKASRQREKRKRREEPRKKRVKREM